MENLNESRSRGVKRHLSTDSTRFYFTVYVRDMYGTHLHRTEIIIRARCPRMR